jgi:flagellar biosynthetic protein FliR
MPLLEQVLVEKFLLFTLVLVRLSGLVLTAPLYGGREAPPQVRALLAFALALLIAPTQFHHPLPTPPDLLMYLVLVGGELLIGACLGLGVMMVCVGLQLAGELVGNVAGLQLADLFDPQLDANIPSFSRLLFLVALAVFVAIGGHRMVMGAMLDTYQFLPPGSGTLPAGLVETFTTIITQSFCLGVRAAAPALAALLLATLVLGLVSRAVPQLNVLVVGFGLNAVITLVALALSLGAAVWAFQDQVPETLQHLLEMLANCP